MKTSAAGLADRMRWLQMRARVISENVANADTPGFAPRDVARPVASEGGAVVTHPRHIGTGMQGGTGIVQAQRFETRPNGNAVSIEDEMLKLSETQMEYQMMAGLYQRSMATLRTALGRRG